MIQNLIRNAMKLKWLGSVPAESNKPALLVPQYNESSNGCFQSRLEYFRDFAKAYTGKVDVIIIDDGSTDDSLEKIKSFLKVNPGAFYAASSYPNGNKVGALFLVTLAIKHRFIILSDFDTDLSGFEHLLDQWPALTNDPDLMGGYFRMLPADGEGSVFRFQQLEYSLHRSLYKFHMKEHSVRVMPGAGSFYKRDILISIYYHHSGLRSGEDREATLLGLKFGYKTLYLDKVTAMTRTPLSFKNLIKQRIRWNLGYLETFAKEKEYYFLQIRNFSTIGIITMLDIFTVIFTLLYPFVIVTLCCINPLILFLLVPAVYCFYMVHCLFLLRLSPNESVEFRGDILAPIAIYPLYKIAVDYMAWTKAIFVFKKRRAARLSERHIKTGGAASEAGGALSGKAEYFEPSPLQLQNREYHYHPDHKEKPDIYTFISPLRKVNFPALRQAANALAIRHDALRSYFPIINGKVKLAIYRAEAGLIPVDQYDLSMKSDPQGAENIVLAGKIKEICDLQKAPLLKIFVCKIKEDLFHLHIIIHHIIADARSVDIIKNELRSFYRDLYNGKGIFSETIPGQLRDYCIRQLQSQKRKQEEHDRFWNEKLKICQKQVPDSIRHASAIALLNQREKAAAFTESISTSLFQALRDRAHEANCSVWSLLYASLCLLLSRQFSKRTVMIASTVSDRLSHENKYTVGNLLGAVYLVTNMEPAMDFKTLLTKVHLDFVRSSRYLIYDHSRLDLDASLLRTRCDLFVNFEPKEENANISLDAKARGHQDGETCYYPLTFCAIEHANGLIFKWVYHKDFYTREQIEMASARHKKILENIACSSFRGVPQSI